MGAEATSELDTDRIDRNRYRKLYRIAKGGIGSVELVIKREGSFERLYAMKMLHPHLREEETFRKMFLQEARIAGLLRHSNVVSVTDVGEGPDGPYLVMEYVEGVTLSQLLLSMVEGELLPIQLCVRIAQQIARGLRAAHELTDHDGHRLDLVHRDISPQNILIGFDGVVRVVDFGIAKALKKENQQTTAGILKGKLGYMAPEQLLFEPPDQRTDLYSLGVVLFELLAGRRLYAGGAESNAPQLILRGPVPDISEDRRDVPASLVALLFDLLAKDREHRPRSARDVAERLGDVLEELAEPPESVEEHLEERFGELRAQMRSKTALALSALQEGRDPTAAVSLADAQPARVEPRPRRAASRKRKPSRGLWIGVGVAVGVLVGGGLGLRYALNEEPVSAEEARSPVVVEPPRQELVEELVEEPAAEVIAAEPPPTQVIEDAGLVAETPRQRDATRMRPTSRMTKTMRPAMERVPDGWWGLEGN